MEDVFTKYSLLSNDIKRLSAYQPLAIAIADAKNEIIHEPIELQLSYWIFETDIPSYPEFELVLAKFQLELGGFK